MIRTAEQGVRIKITPDDVDVHSMEQRTLQDLEQQLFDSRLAARSEAATQLHQTYGEAAVADLAQQYAVLTKWNQRATVVSYAVAYASTSDRAVDLLRSALKDRSGKVRAIALEGFASALRSDTLPELRAFLDTAVDTDAEFARRAIQAIEDQDVPSVIVPEMADIVASHAESVGEAVYRPSFREPRIGLRGWMRRTIDEVRLFIYG